MKVIVDVEAGSERTGVTSADAACELARRIAASAVLRFAGVQAYAGNIQEIASYSERRTAALAELETVRALCRQLTSIGLPPAIVTGGGTGTHDVDRRAGVLTELQAGSYVFMDAVYRSVEISQSTAAPFDAALFVRTTVISVTHHGFATTDAGYKAFATDSGPPAIAKGAPTGATYQFMGDEHGRIAFASPDDRMTLGHGVECLTPHCDPTVNLYDLYHCVQADVVVDLWPIARGRW